MNKPVISYAPSWGRKKLLAYSIFDILTDENTEKKITLFLIEEPENHLHKSMHKLFMYLCDTLKIETFVVGDEKQSIYIWRGAYPFDYHLRLLTG